jgi:hypothetical protein
MGLIVKKKFDMMFGFIFDQPIHKSLRQMRLATIALLVVSVDIMYRLIAILEQGGEMSPAQTVGAVAALATAVFASIWKGISNLAEVHKEDD